MSEKGSVAFWVLLILSIALIVAGGLYWVWWINISTWQGVHYSVEGTVVKVEESTKFYPHTYIDVKITDMSYKSYLLYGVNHNLKTNTRYHIEWTSGTIFRWDELWWNVVGWVDLIQEIK